ncbi:MAG: hypothetical protein IJN65_05915 [Clostridia bacterium]|nr:hypothetical protein [Clostridia bacterium]
MDTFVLAARFKDAVNLSEQKDIPKFLGFLSEDEAGYMGLLAKNSNVKIVFYGGYPQAERTYVGFFPDRMCPEDNLDLFNITALTFTFRKTDILTHRDVLGALMSLGIERDTVGDILIEKGRAVVFLNSKIADYVVNNITKIGRTGVSVQFGYIDPLPQKSELKDITLTVASQRIDAVVAALAGVSRTVACELIESGLVFVNSVTVNKITAQVSSGVTISVRRYGKFGITDIGGTTKKGRVIIKATKYI